MPHGTQTVSMPDPEEGSTVDRDHEKSRRLASPPEKKDAEFPNNQIGQETSHTR